MALTVTNTNSLMLLNILNRTTQNQSNSLTRLSTGSRINSGKDDPAGLIAMRSLETELTAVEAAVTNNERTNAMLSVADKALNEVSSLLNQIADLAQKSANEDGISSDELAANQAQIDNALAAIDRIIGTTEFNGKKLLDGAMGINSSGVDATKISDLKIYSRDPNSSTSITVSLNSAASQAGVTLATTSATSDGSFAVQGKDGSVVIDTTTGENLSAVAAKVNAATAQTGVYASIVSSELRLYSSDFGSAAFVRTNVLSGAGGFNSVNDYGVDADVTVNGQTAAVDGKQVHYSANGVSFSFELTDDYNDGTVTGDESFTIDDTGGATFQLGTESNTRATIGIDGLYTQQLGSASLGYLNTLRGGAANSVLNDPTQAFKIAQAAAEQVATLQGRVGGFQKFQVDTAMNQMNASKEALTAALSSIRDVDYATETAELNRQNVLLQSSIQLLGLANQQSSQILALLR